MISAYEARIPDIYMAEIKGEIAQIIYPSLKSIKLTMPCNIVNLGEQDNKLQTNLDVLSSFVAIGVMEGLEKKVLKNEVNSSENRKKIQDKSWIPDFWSPKFILEKAFFLFQRSSIGIHIMTLKHYSF
ncbi:hypothetical protein [Candidatus Parabeggiatoa sp. HSG14]|uniref:hypothetical protein n=1 Tax=Candidatus Parabeggiatoa sp. HSG14 TaxID=3055593 RepID=UPI0025A710FD|nr:hypothetical protein [Thiotrichales bacterium HSG14]